MPPPLLAIVGATATGKTALAIDLARRFDGEIVNADSRQIYRGMDLGTAKPTQDEQQQTRHWLIDIIAPDEAFTLAAYLDLASAAIADITRRGRLPIAVGGTGQYAWALLEGWRLPRVPPDRALRAELEALAERDGADAVFALLEREDAPSAAAIDRRNVRRVIRAIEVTRATGRPFSAWREKREPGYQSTIIGLRLDRDALHRRVDARVEEMMADGLAEEVQRLNAAGYPCDLRSMNSIGYRQICEYLGGGCTLDAAVARIKTETHRLVRMQRAWFQPEDPRIHWLDADAPDLVDRAARITEAAALPDSRSGAVS
jgi:tRNA dimethylallyltransferase